MYYGSHWELLSKLLNSWRSLIVCSSFRDNLPFLLASKFKIQNAFVVLKFTMYNLQAGSILHSSTFTMLHVLKQD